MFTLFIISANNLKHELHNLIVFKSDYNHLKNYEHKFCKYENTVLVYKNWTKIAQTPATHYQDTLYTD